MYFRLEPLTNEQSLPTFTTALYGKSRDPWAYKTMKFTKITPFLVPSTLPGQARMLFLFMRTCPFHQGVRFGQDIHIYLISGAQSFYQQRS